MVCLARGAIPRNRTPRQVKDPAAGKRRPVQPFWPCSSRRQALRRCPSMARYVASSWTSPSRRSIVRAQCVCAWRRAAYWLSRSARGQRGFKSADLADQTGLGVAFQRVPRPRRRRCRCLGVARARRAGLLGPASALASTAPRPFLLEPRAAAAEQRIGGRIARDGPRMEVGDLAERLQAHRALLRGQQVEPGLEACQRRRFPRRTGAAQVCVRISGRGRIRRRWLGHGASPPGEGRARARPPTFLAGPSTRCTGPA